MMNYATITGKNGSIKIAGVCAVNSSSVTGKSIDFLLHEYKITPTLTSCMARGNNFVGSLDLETQAFPRK